MLNINQNDVEIRFDMILVESPPPEILSRAQIKFINKLIFEVVQEIQSNVKVRTNKEILEYIVSLDKELDLYIEQSMKIRDRDVRKAMMEEIGEAKDKTSKVIEVLRSSSGGHINNAQIA